MTGRSEERPPGRGEGRPGAESPSGDWYVADTYAQDPYAADAYQGPEDGPDPYGLRAARPAAPQQQAAAYDVPPQLPPQGGGYPTPVPPASFAPPVPPVQPGWDTPPQEPAADWPDAPATWERPAPVGGQWAGPQQGQQHGQQQHGQQQHGQQQHGQQQWQPGPAHSAWDSESTEYVGVDALFGGGRTGLADPAAEVRPPAQQPPVQQPQVQPLLAQPPVAPAPHPSSAPFPPADAYRGGPGGPGGHGGHQGGPNGQDGQRPPVFVPPIEFDPPLSEEEATMQVAAVQIPPAVEPLEDLAAEEHAPAAPAPAAGGGKVASLLNSSAIMAAGTLVSRGTGFVRTMVITAAIGVGIMGDSYNAAGTLPTLLYILIGGGALNAVFVPQLVRSMKNDADGGTAYANRLLTLVMVGLGVVVLLAVAGAPLLVQLISHPMMANPARADTTVALARYCLPTIFFMGIHVVMGQILNARGRFGAMMWTPVLNNIVVIFTFGAYIWVYGGFGETHVTPEGISPEGVRLLGIGTLVGLVVQALAMIPYLRAADFHFRPRFDWRGHGLGKAARLAKWTFFFVLANQAGYLVITQLATAAGSAAEKGGHNGVGLAAFSNALLIWQLPQAVIVVSLMSAVLPRLSRAAADDDAGAVRDDISYGLRTTAVAVVPGAFLFLSLGPAIGRAIYAVGGSETALDSATNVGLMLSAFALGLIPYSAQYVMLRGFYAYEDTRTPFSNTVWVAACQAVFSLACWFLLPAEWTVVGMAFGYGLAYAVGVTVAVPKLKKKIGGLDTKRIGKTYARLIAACVPAALVGVGVSLAVQQVLGGWLGSVLTIVLAGGLQLAVFVLIAKKLRIEELNAMLGMVRGRLGR
ncbi:murein biosynthesis integral membrane protein MurJ [Kitasatospora sp. RG8]|uniref:murein biosynthesis integral membrane protein MurJ n=1 Tax=Kitasatospora sp. RG8 TaxID=2820815 RepID=UPI001ADF5125|nr:murein biosynthesis integral membrane protein MurJ [Kitasatospora sp. RG8]MBP0453912.1 murein biosynthesis integral membrane protein MurJ [Kitasatospora sp. RG8]